jgi:hypothetical protein
VQVTEDDGASRCARKASLVLTLTDHWADEGAFLRAVDQTRVLRRRIEPQTGIPGR